MAQASSGMLAFASFATMVAAVESSDTEGRSEPIAGFLPSQAASLIAACAFFLTTVLLWAHFHRSGRPWYFSVLPLSMTTMTGGFVLRFFYHNHPEDLAWYISYYCLLLLSPIGFLAADYILLPRLGRAMGDEIAKKAFVLPVRLIVKFFLTADIITLLIQMSGGGLMASGGDMASLGNKAMLVGLIVQVLTFSFFTLVLLIFGWRVHRRYSHLVHPNTPFKINRFNPFSIEPVSDWRVLFWILVITCVGIEVRCVFRILEGIGGHDSYLAVHEVFFYLFDCVPLWISMTLFAYVWPLRVIDGVAMEGSTTRFDSRHEVFRRISTHEDANVSFTSEGPYDSKYGGRPQSGDVPLYPYRA